MSASLRSYLKLLDHHGELVRVEEQVDSEYELAAVLSLLEAGPAVRFGAVRGAQMPVVGNVVTSRRRAALALDTTEEGVVDRLADSIERPLPSRVVASGACHEVVRQPDLYTLPVPWFFAQETGRYITAGVILVADVVTGERNMSFARFKVLDERRAMLGVSPNHHLGQMAERARQAGTDLPIAVAIGVHPALMLAACLYLGFGDDELASAGRLLGSPVDVVTALDSTVLVPAEAEIVAEGVVKADERIEEGLVSEFHGRYHDYGPGYAVEFTRLTHRHDPLFQTIIPGLHREHVVLGAVSIAAGLRTHLRRTYPNVVDVAVPDSGTGRVSAVVSVRAVEPGQAEELINACLSAVALIKQVVVVDEEVDVWNPEAVEWARLYHARPERDVVVVPHARSDRSDPLARDLTVGKLGVDATRKEGDRVEGWDFARPPRGAWDRARGVLARAGIAERRSRLNRGIGYRDVNGRPRGG